MELREFVRSTITEVVAGIELAKEDLKETDVLINPSTIRGVVSAGKNYDRAVQSIDFDLSVSFSERKNEANSKEAGISSKIQVVSIFNLNLGGKIEDREEWENINGINNRVKFSVPVSFPTNLSPSIVPSTKVSGS